MDIAVWDPTYPRVDVSPTDLYRQHIEEAVFAERCGFHHYWLFEHHFSPKSPMPAPNLMTAAIAQHTSKIRLGNMVHVLPYRNPIILAEEIAFLDALTNGRLDVGVGRGLKPTEFQAFGLSQDESRAMFYESLEVMTGIWTKERFKFEGKYFKVNKETPLCPEPVQKPYPPLYVSAQSRESLQGAAERDLPFGQIDAMIDECCADQAFYHQAQVASGFAKRPRLFLTREVYVAETDEKAREIAYPYLMAYWQLWTRYAQFTRDGAMPDSYESWRKRAPKLHALTYAELMELGMVLVGSPQTVARQVRRHVTELDPAILVCVFQLGHMPQEMAQKSMQLFAHEVMPIVRSEPAAITAVS
jgi:alkanesulfonate monooxygenase SsuD/methylene tetrahydromethanopterin reductase-like flavin-dependent oxidoreductase (luciferase family)